MIIDPYTWHRLPIQHVSLLASDTLSVRVPRPAGYTYQAGQYAIARVPVQGAPLLRQYSFVSCPDNDFLEFLIQREPSGAVSNWFHEIAKVGASIEISQPFGSFVAEAGPHPLLFVAGRVGVAPFISMIRDQLTLESPGRISLLYSARGKTQFCYRDLLASVATTFFDTETGSRIDTESLKKHLEPTTRVYLCGSKQFVDSLTHSLEELGVASGQIKRELFTLQ